MIFRTWLITENCCWSGPYETNRTLNLSVTADDHQNKNLKQIFLKTSSVASYQHKRERWNNDWGSRVFWGFRGFRGKTALGKPRHKPNDIPENTDDIRQLKRCWGRGGGRESRRDSKWRENERKHIRPQAQTHFKSGSRGQWTFTGSRVQNLCSVIRANQVYFVMGQIFTPPSLLSESDMDPQQGSSSLKSLYGPTLQLNFYRQFNKRPLTTFDSTSGFGLRCFSSPITEYWSLRFSTCVCVFGDCYWITE